MLATVKMMERITVDIVQLATSIPTFGTAGFEHFNLAGQDYISSANFWDGHDRDMGAHSTIFLINDKVERDGITDLSFTQTQTFWTHGAHGVDFFWGNMSTDSTAYLVIPSYYECEQKNRNCFSTFAYAWSSIDHNFKNVLNLRSRGPSQTDHFTSEENFGSEVTVHKLLNRNPSGPVHDVVARHLQSLPIPGVAGCAVLEINSSWYLIAASYHDNGWRTQSKVFEFDARREAFVEIQSLDSYGAHDAEGGTFNGDSFVVLSEDRSDAGCLITSKVYIWNSKRHKFDLLQELPTDGAHAAEFFVMGGRFFLAVANFGDRQNNRYNAESTVWEYIVPGDINPDRCTGDRATHPHSHPHPHMCSPPGDGRGDDGSVFSDSNGGIGGRDGDSAVNGHPITPPSHQVEPVESYRRRGWFELVAGIPTYGATDWEYFKRGGRHYLAVSEEGDLSQAAGKPTDSHVYQIVLH